MKARFLIYVVVTLMFLGLASVAQAQATRTWVSGVGDDANPCSRTAPCKTFAGAISKTATGGIISVLDPGGYGTLTITKSITVEGTGTLASSLFSSVNGFVINAGNTGVVVLRDLLVNGAGTTLGIDGVRILNAAEVTLDNVKIDNFSGNGINVVPNVASQLVKVVVRNCQVTNGLRGIQVLPTGVGATVKLQVEGSSFSGHQGGSGIDIGGASNVAHVSNSVMTHNATGIQVQQASSTAFVEASNISFNATGVQAAGPIHLSNCMVVGNTTNGLSASNVTSYLNSTIVGNTGDNTPNSSVAQQ